MLGMCGNRVLAAKFVQGDADFYIRAIMLAGAVGRSTADEPPRRGRILDAVRRSPLVGADLDLARSREPAASSTCDPLPHRYQRHSQYCRDGSVGVVLAWTAEQMDEALFIASLTVAEIRRDVLEKPTARK